MSCALSGNDVLQHVQQFWSMLDDLNENDPEAYRKFIQKQMKQGAEITSAPQLHSSLCTQILKPKPGLLYINICSWACVPAPQDMRGTLPVRGGKLETGTKEGQGWYAVLDLAFNPEVLQGTKQDTPDISRVYMLALSFAQQQHRLRLSEKYRIVTWAPNSSPDHLRSRLKLQMQPNFCKQPETASQTPAALLQQISSLRSKEDYEHSPPQSICRPAEQRKNNLIQVVSSTFVEPERPEYHLEVKNDSAGVPHSLELTIELPKVRSMSECELTVSKEDILLKVEDVYFLLLEWPKDADEDSASAVFNKKTRRLRVKVDLL